MCIFPVYFMMYMYNGCFRTIRDKYCIHVLHCRVIFDLFHLLFLNCIIYSFCLNPFMNMQWLVFCLLLLYTHIYIILTFVYCILHHPIPFIVQLQGEHIHRTCHSNQTIWLRIYTFSPPGEKNLWEFLKVGCQGLLQGNDIPQVHQKPHGKHSNFI